MWILQRKEKDKGDWSIELGVINLRIPILKLPETLPSGQAICSFGDNQHSYEPEFWELQYQLYRYLEGVSGVVLAERYSSILNNMRALISRDRDVIPIQSFLSSWYWFRKEHQTRFEFALRGIQLPVPPPYDAVFDNKALGAPIRPKHVNAGDVLFRYDRRQGAETCHIEAMRRNGIVRIRPASDFREIEQDKARQDEELSKKSFLPGSHTRITTQDGREIPIIGNVQQTVSMPNYYVWCVACDWDNGLFTHFNADCCIVIKDGDEFVRRLEVAVADLLPGWYFHHNPVQYFDPYEKQRDEFFDAAMSKDFRFAYQREYRFLWFPENVEDANGFIYPKLGCLEDLVEFFNA